ncbi:hypothetical protein D3C80_1422270 [compost metagenome]
MLAERKTPPPCEISMGVAKYLEVMLNKILRSKIRLSQWYTSPGLNCSSKYLNRLLPNSLICNHKLSLSYTLMIPAADASERGFKTQGAETVSAKVLMS